jgi:hypothetical protein
MRTAGSGRKDLTPSSRASLGKDGSGRCFLISVEDKIWEWGHTHTHTYIYIYEKI